MMPYLPQRWAEGYTNASHLWREIAARGYSGVRKQVARFNLLFTASVGIMHGNVVHPHFL